jgi:aminomethyltransferase
LRGAARAYPLYGEDGFEIFTAPDDAAHVWNALRAAGSAYGLVPAGLACRDTLRLEAGMPLYGHELSTEITPYAAGLGRVVKLDKTEPFFGQQALATAAESTPARRLVGLIASGKRALRAGYTVLDPSTSARIGEITSGAPSPTLGHPIAMAYVDAALALSGIKVHVDVRGRAEPAEIVDLPFYRRPR